MFIYFAWGIIERACVYWLRLCAGTLWAISAGSAVAPFYIRRRLISLPIKSFQNIVSWTGSGFVIVCLLTDLGAALGFRLGTDS